MTTLSHNHHSVALMVSEVLPVPAVCGGAVEVWVEEVARRLKRTSAVCFSYDHPALSGEAHGSSPARFVHYRPSWVDRLCLSTYKLPFKQDHHPLYYWPYARWCAKRMKQAGCSIVHIHNRPHFVRTVRRVLPEARIILHCHQVSIMNIPTVWTAAMLDEVDGFVGCSDFIRRTMRDRFHLPEEKTAVLPNGYDPERFCPVDAGSSERQDIRRKLGLKEDDVAVLFAGRLAENKGCLRFLRALDEFIEENPEGARLRGVICGAHGYVSRRKTPYVEAIEQTRCVREGRVTFAGFVPKEDMPRYYQAADLVVIPSEVDEGFCLIALEALACGVPLMAVERGGIPEVTRGDEWADLIAEPFGENFKTRLKEFLAAPEKLRAKARRAAEAVPEIYGWDRVVARVEDLYARLSDAA